MRTAAALRERIVSGEIAIGAALPSTRDIKKEHGVSVETAQRALHVLADEGLIRRWPGVGYHRIK
jgi:GntR family transcriptional regulator